MTTEHLHSSKLQYQAPLLDVYQYVVEHGFAESPESTTIAEQFREINDQSESNSGSGTGHAGENYHGEWY